MQSSRDLGQMRRTFKGSEKEEQYQNAQIENEEQLTLVKILGKFLF